MVLAIIVVGLLLALAGIGLIVAGVTLFIIFRLGLRMFDQSLKTEYAGETREQIERAALRIKNGIARRFVLNHVVGTATAVAVSTVRSGIKSQMNKGLWLAVAGAVALLSSLFTGLWLPSVWSSVQRYLEG